MQQSISITEHFLPSVTTKETALMFLGSFDDSLSREKVHSFDIP